MNHPHTIEYSQMNSSNESRCTILRTGESWRVKGRMIRLEHVTAGYTLGGSAAVWTDECWAVRYNEDGKRFGRTCRDKAKADAIFDGWTDESKAELARFL